MAYPKVERLKTPEDCRQFAKNQVEQGNLELAVEARRRAVYLEALVAFNTGPSEVELELMQVLIAQEDALTHQRGRVTHRNRTRSKMEKDGLIATAEYAVLKKGESPGFSSMAELGLEDMTFEAVMIRRPEEFSPEAVAAARSKLP